MEIQKLKDDIASFISDYGSDDPAKLLLKYCSVKERSETEREYYRFAILQIEARRKFASKFRRLIEQFPTFLFPTILAGEQASHEEVAHYHASLVSKKRYLIDMTAGLGIDFLTMTSAISMSGENCTAVELDGAKASVLTANLATIGLADAKVINDDSVVVIKKMATNESIVATREDRLIFVDPARRGEGDRRLYDPADCQPDIISNRESMERIASRIIIKNSPLLDIKRALQLFSAVGEIHIVAVRNECKEVLVVCDDSMDSLRIFCVNINAGGSREIFSISGEEFLATPQEALRDIRFTAEDEDLSAGWLYEPNATLMKAGCHHVLSNRFPTLRKFSPNCHLFFSDERIQGFPGRELRISAVVNKESAKQLKGRKLNVATRNYPQRPAEIEKRYKLKSSPTAVEFLYGATVGRTERPLLLLATSI